MVPLGRNAGFRPGIWRDRLSAEFRLAIVRGPVLSVTAIGHDFGLERAAFDRLACARQRFHGVGVLIPRVNW